MIGDRFDESPPADLEGSIDSELVVRILRVRGERAWKAADIVRRTGVNENSIHPVLSRLEARSSARNEAPRWTFTDDLDRLRRTDDIHRATRLFDGPYVEEDLDGWTKASERDE